MKAQVMMFTCLLSLVGCEQIGKTAFNSVADPSAKQQKSAEQAYNALEEKNVDAFYQQLTPELKAKFMQDEKTVRKFSSSLPKTALKDKKIVSKHYDEKSQNPQYTVTYEYRYDQNLVQYDVTFDQPNGSDKISQLNIAVFGESTK